MISSISNVAMHILPRTIPPGGVTAQVLVKVLPTTFELRPNETDPVEIRSHGKAFVFFLHFFIAGVLLRERLMVQG